MIRCGGIGGIAGDPLSDGDEKGPVLLDDAGVRLRGDELSDFGLEGGGGEMVSFGFSARDPSGERGCSVS